MVKIVYNIDTIYKKYIVDVNNLINNDYRFNNLDIEYRGIPMIDLLYNIFTNNNNTYIYNYGFYYKYNDVYINYIESYQGVKIYYKLLRFNK